LVTLERSECSGDRNRKCADRPGDGGVRLHLDRDDYFRSQKYLNRLSESDAALAKTREPDSREV
jgi:hypothetical protein